LPLLSHAGFVRAAPHEAMMHSMWMARDAHDPHYELLEHVLTAIVGENALCTFADLGFQEMRPDLRGIGTRMPNVVLLVEKHTLREGVDAVTQALGPSWIIMGGLSTYTATEFFVRALDEAGVQGPLIVLAYVDFDPQGWNVARAFAKHLLRYGQHVAATSYLVRPQRFTKKELKSIALPLVATTPAVRSATLAWIRESGGVDGKGLGIHADHLWPPHRVVQAFNEELALLK
jgi:hypothetical protein